MSSRRARIKSMGRYVPERILSNADLERMVDTSDEWIRARTGIVERRIVEPGTPTSDLALRAAREALERGGVAPSEIDLIIVATVTPDMVFPATACLLQDKLKATHAWAFDIWAACSGFIYALTVGSQFIESGAHKTVLVIAADVLTSIVDYKDRNTCVLFGDGAGAAVLVASDDDRGLLAFHNEADGSRASLVTLPAGGSAKPTSHETIDARLHFLRQAGDQVFKMAVRKMAESAKLVVESQNLGVDNIDWFVPHQANARIIDAAADRLGVPPSKVVKNIERYGNTSAATIPLALCSALDERKFSPDDLVVLAAVGAGLTVGAAAIRWSEVPWS